MPLPAVSRRLVLAAALLPAVRARAQETAPLIAAAATLRFALVEIAGRFRAETGHAVRLAFGSSGNLVRQIEQGSPVELFLSADEAFVFRLAEGGHARDRGELYAVGRIVLLTPPGSPVRAEAGLDGLRAALEAGQIRRFAIANPEHAPYGHAAEQALRAAGLWERIRPHLVIGENVAQAAQFALAGGSQGGIVAYSLALAPALRGRGSFELLPETLHEPLHQRMALTRRAGPVAERFYAYLQAPAAREIMRRHGFLLPGE
ncbi:molybdate ABC transporter substrate-binding protein [Falsiroseomonas sp.]|uniref:molybdate ABC transporter substrate-binding protein n=1 Tax=Falsiroseomonas sp. TaxID=2870721 RepID=UPI0035670A05